MTAVSQTNPAHGLTAGRWLSCGVGGVAGFSPREWPDAWGVSEDVSDEETWSRSGESVMGFKQLWVTSAGADFYKYCMKALVYYC